MPGQTPPTTEEKYMFDKLGPRGREVAQLVASECQTSKEGVRKLGISFCNVETHRTHTCDKLGVRNIVEPARYLVRIQ
jgi:DNA-binding CsgD family transcriptional regulator